MSGNPEVVAANGCGLALEGAGLYGVMAADLGAFGVRHRQLAGQGIELLEGGLASLAALGPTQQFGPGHERHGQAVVACELIDARSQLRRPVLDQADKDVGVEQVDQRLSRSCTGLGLACSASRLATKLGSKPARVSSRD